MLADFGRELLVSKTLPGDHGSEGEAAPDVRCAPLADIPHGAACYEYLSGTCRMVGGAVEFDCDGHCSQG